MPVPRAPHDSGYVREAAVEVLALGSVGSKIHREAILAALSDPSARMCRAARRILLRGAPVDPERLTFAALSSYYPHERRAAVELAGAHDYWVAGVLLVRIAGTRDPETAARAAAALTAWESRYNRVFTKPTPRQVDEFESLVDAASVDAGLRNRLRALVPSLRARSG